MDSVKFSLSCYQFSNIMTTYLYLQCILRFRKKYLTILYMRKQIHKKQNFSDVISNVIKIDK